jgi:hypothetical protein
MTQRPFWAGAQFIAGLVAFVVMLLVALMTYVALAPATLMPAEVVLILDFEPGRDSMSQSKIGDLKSKI